MPMQIWARINGDKGFYLVVEDTATPPPKGAKQADGSIKLEGPAAADFLKQLSIEALRGAMPGTTVVLGDDFADASPRARREHVQQALLAADEGGDEETSAPRGAEVPADADACKSCSAPVIWAEWATTGRPAILDAAPVPDGNLALVAGKVRHYQPADAKVHRERYRSHFATCPHAGQWRGRKR
jgi:hypothetical protein